ncbi:YeiH family protein [Altererythrobacter sp. GH1-8]|uniref:YeiH family protein n=1 Tax=Altererythrobacter sp. GH1-8 TaxID=3349333 RepID=UPI00374D2A7F
MDDRNLYAGDLYGELALSEQVQPRGPRSLRGFLPGLLLVGVTSLAAAWLSDHYGMPVVLIGLLLGLALNFAASDKSTHSGLDLLAREGLRIGIVLLGFQITAAQIVDLGAGTFVLLIGIMAMTFAAGLIGAKIWGQSRYAGILAGGATAICGASASLALFAVIGRERLPQAQLAMNLVAVALASATAMAIYPVIAVQIGLDESSAGFLIGASVHDVAQAIGGGFSISDTAGREATIVKLARVTMLAPIVVLVSLWIGSADKGQASKMPFRRLALPWFIVGFLALVAANSILEIPTAVTGAALSVSKALLLLAVTATALRARTDLMRALGWRAFMPVACASLVSFVCAILAAIALGM